MRVHGDEHSDRGAIARPHHLDRIAGEFRCREPLANALGNREIRCQRLGAAAQDGRVAGLQAQPRGIGGDVGTGLVDDPDHPERHPHPSDLQARRPHPHLADLADGVRQRRDLPQPLGHGSNARIGELEPVEQRGGESARSPCIEIPAIRRLDVPCPLADRVGDGDEGAILGVGRRARQRLGSGARPRAEVEHVGVEAFGLDFTLRDRAGGDCGHGCHEPALRCSCGRPCNRRQL